MYKILKSFKGSHDGFTIINYTTGEVVDLAPNLVRVGLEEGWIEEEQSQVVKEVRKQRASRKTVKSK